MRLPLGVSPIRPACERCGGKTMFSGRDLHPTRGLPWEIRTFVCTACSAVTTRHTGASDDDTAAGAAPVASGASIRSAIWAGDYGTYTTVLDGLAYRIVAYPRGSPLAGKYGCYCDGRYTGLMTDLAAAKAWCCTLAESSGVQPA